MIYVIKYTTPKWYGESRHDVLQLAISATNVKTFISLDWKYN